MNRNNFIGHLSLALVLILVAAFAGQVRRWNQPWRAFHRPHVWNKEGRRSYPIYRDPMTRDARPDDGPAEVLVRFRSTATPDTIRNIVARLNDRIEDRIESVSGLDVIEDENGETAEHVAAEYRELPEVEYAEPNYKIRLEEETAANPALPGDPRFDEQWALNNDGQNGGKAGADVSALKAWKVTKGSDQVVVAVVDSGVDYTHRDLAANIWTRPANIKQYQDEDLTTDGPVDDEHGFDTTNDTPDPMDQNGHGTHCAGIIGAEGDNDFGIVGINWKVQIMPLRFIDASGSGTTKAAIEAINYVIDRKKAGVNVRIISASWGSTAKSRALEDVIRKAYDEGILFVAAAGNSSSDNDSMPHYPASYNIGNVVSVAALDRNDELASFSNFGVKSVQIAAPGKEIISTWLGDDFREASGTSMATPYVSGIAALILSKHPKMSVDELRAKLLKSVDKLPSLDGKVTTGGRINAAKAVGAN
jgi:subtilisin family serine protease